LQKKHSGPEKTHKKTRLKSTQLTAPGESVMKYLRGVRTSAGLLHEGA
jgi:hypothetical protein